MGFWQAVTGRSKPKAPRMDALFALPTAAITLQTAADLTMTGRGAICFRAAEGPAFAQAIADTIALLDADDDPDVEKLTDQFGFTWVLARQEDMGALATDLHAVVTQLELQGFAHTVLCALVSFSDPSGRSVALVYLYKQGTFYPFAPEPGNAERRDSVLELQVKALIQNDLRLEPDTSRWFPVWGAPGLEG